MTTISTWKKEEGGRDDDEAGDLIRHYGKGTTNQGERRRLYQSG
jgi:hypothetical protein